MSFQIVSFLFTSFHVGRNGSCAGALYMLGRCEVAGNQEPGTGNREPEARNRGRACHVVAERRRRETGRPERVFEGGTALAKAGADWPGEGPDRRGIGGQAIEWRNWLEDKKVRRENSGRNKVFFVKTTNPIRRIRSLA